MRDRGALFARMKGHTAVFWHQPKQKRGPPPNRNVPSTVDVVMRCAAVRCSRSATSEANLKMPIAMPTRARKLLRALAGVFVLILVLMIAVPWLFKDRIVAELKQAANAQLNAEVDFSDARLSLFRHFPDLQLSIRELRITGKGPFAGVPLAQIEALHLRIDLLSVLRSNRPIAIERATLSRPEMRILILPDGQANYDITLPDTAASTAAPTPFAIELHRYDIRQGRLYYEDRQADLRVEAVGLTHGGSGRFTESVFDLHTQTRIDSLTVVSGGIAWLDEAQLRLDATLGVDLNRMRFDIKDNELAINALALSVEGWIALLDDGIDMDVSVRAADNAFASLFSLVPGAFVEGYESIEAGGTFRFAATARGRYASDTWPAFELQLAARDGSIRYPGMALGIEQVRAQVHLAHPGGPPDLLRIDLSELAFQVGRSTLSAKFSLRTPLSDPELDAHLDAQLDLAEWARAFPMKDVQALQGTFAGQLVARARLSQLEKGAHEQVQMRGSFALRDFTYARADMPRVVIPVLSGRLQPDALRITRFESRLGRSDLQGHATLRNLLGWFAEGQHLSGQFRLQAATLDLDEWLSESEAERTAPTPAPTPAPARGTAPAEKWRFEYELSFDRLLYEPYELRALNATGSLTPQRLDIRAARGRLGASEFVLSGTLTNLMNFATYNETLGGQLKVESPFTDYDDLMPPAASEAPEAASPSSPMPDFHYDIRFEGYFRQFAYAPYMLKDLRLTGRLTEEAIAIDRFSTRIGRSDLAGSGTLRNYLEYVYLDQPVNGEWTLEANLLDADELMAAGEGESDAAAGESSGVYEVPSAFEFDILARADQLVYSGIPLHNVSGKLAMAGGTLLFEDFRADALGGQMALSGRYSTADPQKPAFAIKYELKDLLFQEAFRKLATFRALAPIAQFVEGKFHSSLIVEGLLGPDMMPRLHTLDAEGFLKTADALIKGFPPLEQLSRQLDLPFFSQLPLEGVEAWFEIQDGTVEIKPVDYTWQDIQMNISGKHRLDGLMDYQIVARIPRSRFTSNPVGAQAAASADWLQQQASALGLPLEGGEFVKLRIALGGTIQKPEISVKLLGFEGGAHIAQKAAEAATAQAERMIEEKRTEVAEEVQAQKDSAVQQLRQKTSQMTDSLKIQAEKKAEEVVEEVKKKAGEEVGKKVEEIVGQEAKKEVEEIKNKLEKWNPFGKKDKKKKEGGH